jgi:hypothetical protein
VLLTLQLLLLLLSGRRLSKQHSGRDGSCSVLAAAAGGCITPQRSVHSLAVNINCCYCHW